MKTTSSIPENHYLSLDADWGEALPRVSEPSAAKVTGPFRGHFDGASRGNPGEAGAGALLVDASGTPVWTCARPLGRKTNNEAEYAALVLLLEEILARGLAGVSVRGDSQLVVNQVTGRWKVKEPRLQELAERAKELLKATRSSLSWVPREENKDADALSNEALDGPVKPSPKALPGKGGDDPAAFPPERLERIAGFIYIAHGSEDYAVDVLHKACTCPSFQHRKRCKHLDAAERLA